MAKTPFKLKGFTGFKSSPLEQDYVKDIYDAKWNPSGTKDASGKVIKKSGGKVAKKLAGKAATRIIPGIGWALAAYDVGKLSYHSIKEGSLSAGWKKFWE